MRVHVKICGLTDARGVAAAAEAGADAVGFVLASSRRQVTPHVASRLGSQLPHGVDRVAVFFRPARLYLVESLAVFDAGVVQADHDYLNGVPRERRLPVFRESKQVHVELESFAAAASTVRFVYEGPRSGAGRPVDWDRASVLASRGRMTLAGGLDPDNVRDAVRTVRPFGVDVSSGVESSPGVKDPGRIRAFVEAVREAERELVVR